MVVFAKLRKMFDEKRAPFDALKTCRLNAYHKNQLQTEPVTIGFSVIEPFSVLNPNDTDCPG